MAIKTERVVIPARPEKVEEREAGVICDLCGADSTECFGTGWGKKSSDVETVHLVRQSGYDYSDVEQSYVIDQIDLCPTCWETRLLPWLAEQGVKPRGHHQDYRMIHDW